MSKLSEIAEFAERHAEELEGENVNSSDFWIAQMGLVEDDVVDHMQERIQKYFAVGLLMGTDIVELLAVAFLDGLTHGYVLATGRHKEPV